LICRESAAVFAVNDGDDDNHGDEIADDADDDVVDDDGVAGSITT